VPTWGPPRAKFMPHQSNPYRRILRKAHGYVDKDLVTPCSSAEAHSCLHLSLSPLKVWSRAPHGAKHFTSGKTPLSGWILSRQQPGTWDPPCQASPLGTAARTPEVPRMYVITKLLQRRLAQWHPRSHRRAVSAECGLRCYFRRAMKAQGDAHLAIKTISRSSGSGSQR